MSARAASGSRAPAAIPAANTVISWISGGSGPTIVDAGNGQQLAHLLEADLGFAAGHDCAHRLAFDLPDCGRPSSAATPSRRNRPFR